MKLKPYFAQLKVKRIGGPYEILRFEKKEGEEIAVSELHTDGGIAAALAARRINKLFPIQRFLMECVKSGRNILARSRAGTGKTIAFEIPILEKISWRKRQKCLAGAEVDVIVGTPKSVIQMCKMDVVNLNAVQFTVLVETARMLAVAVNDVGVIMEKLPTRCQRIMFSAGILSPNIRKFAKEYFRDLLTIDLVSA
ncbi:DEAD-box ATP-dependent RNA helicase 53, mitochondrial-like [Papaver somniferum]|uniref:DEAD-box ATP-dependent RNA helicase 53, mitochondrial-like n=1 Tax=Papaver somniferum TaxID=3469 RepID=UPI000E702414|nr:DEAD-box ATP-dependent RNA helicase 53, mitochondrial-like [Papaver somniferum]